MDFDRRRDRAKAIRRLNICRANYYRKMKRVGPMERKELASLALQVEKAKEVLKRR